MISVQYPSENIQTETKKFMTPIEYLLKSNFTFFVRVWHIIMSHISLDKGCTWNKDGDWPVMTAEIRALFPVKAIMRLIKWT